MGGVGFAGVLRDGESRLDGFGGGERMGERFRAVDVRLGFGDRERERL